MTDTCFCGRSERHTKTEGCYPTPSIQLPSGTERERRIARAKELLKDAQMVLDRLSRSVTQSDALFLWHTSGAQKSINEAARLLRGIPND